jgi:imidazolonepropionase-like amidohydrolase
MRSIAVCVLLLSVGCSTANEIAITGISVISMTAPVSVVPDQTVVIRGETIVTAGARDKVRVSRGATRIDGTGKYLMPGLVDAHVHLEYFDDPELLRLFIAHGVTTVRNMDGRPQVLGWRDAHVPRIVTAGPILDGAPPLLPDNLSLASADAARVAVREQQALGYDFVKVYTNLSPEVYAAIVDEARRVAMPVAGHVPRGVALDEAVKSQGGLEHLADFMRWTEAADSPHRGKFHWSKLLVAAPVDPQKLAEVARSLAAAGAYVTPTMVQTARSVATPETVAKWMNAAELAVVPQEFRDEWERRVKRASERLEGEDWEVVARGERQRGEIVRALHAANVTLVAGTDTPNPFVVPGVSLHEELRYLVAAGVPIADALVAATRAPCEVMRLDCGTIAAGKRADLLVLAGNPLDDLAHLVPIAVIAAGRVEYDHGSHARARTVRSQRPLGDRDRRLARSRAGDR